MGASINTKNIEVNIKYENFLLLQNANAPATNPKKNAGITITKQYKIPFQIGQI